MPCLSFHCSIFLKGNLYLIPGVDENKEKLENIFTFDHHKQIIEVIEPKRKKTPTYSFSFSLSGSQRKIKIFFKKRFFKKKCKKKSLHFWRILQK